MPGLAGSGAYHLPFGACLAVGGAPAGGLLPPFISGTSLAPRPAAIFAASTMLANRAYLYLIVFGESPIFGKYDEL